MQMRLSDSARLVPVCEGKSLIAANSSAPVALVLKARPTDGLTEIFLGIDAKHSYFAVDISPLQAAEREAFVEQSMDIEQSPRQGIFQDLRSIGPLLAYHEGSLLAYARGLVYWNNHTRHCTLCGNLLISSHGGHVRNCPQCQHTAFPRTDPAVIMLVTHQEEDGPDRCLLGRNSAWPNGVFSILAGFVEPGESLEMAVQREVLEEASIHTDDVRYVASQPWPFPRSIMLGFEARATTTDIVCNPAELAEAHWFTRKQLKTFGNWADQNDGYKLPRTDSIARHLIDRWIEQGD